jgi:hypothetical protein
MKALIQLKLFYSPSGCKKNKQNGLLIINDANKMKVYPKLVSNDPDVIGIRFIILCYQDL